jgi:outer membrane protein OmpA-like peptidoglycan-associated protein
MKTAFRKAVILSLLIFLFTPLFSQVLTKKGFIKAVQDADAFYYYDQDYENAAILYEPLVKSYPENYNLAAKLGICYLNIDGKKAEALKLLIKASASIVSYDKDYIEYGEKAPLDTYLYLAIAYHKNDSLQKAVLLYTNAKRKLGGTQLFRSDYIDKQIKDCRYAMEMQKKPLYVSTNLFIPWLSEYPGAYNPAISENDSVFVFTVKKEGKTRILCSYKKETWKKPTDITRQLGQNDGFYSNSITGNGKLLILYINDGGDGNLYYSLRKDSTWTKIKNLGKNINTIYWESHGFITPDGNTLYFTSNRPGGSGELDIWISEKDKDGSWKRPVNCGNVINTPYNETTPFYDNTTGSLLFSSEGNSTMGGYDVFRSEKRNGVWTKPVGLPYSFNSIDDNIFFIPETNKHGYLTSLYNEKNGTRDIYSLKAEDPADKTIRAEGTISLQDGMAVDPVQTQIKLFDQKTGALLKNISVSDSGSFKVVMKPGNFKVLITRIGDKTDTINLNVNKAAKTESKALIDTASFSFEIKPGDYQLFVNHVGYKTDTINLSIPSRFPGTYISINSSLIPEKVFNGDFLTIKNLLFDFDSYKLTEKSIATLEVLNSILLIYQELKIEVAGYTDSKGSTEYNTNLADRRAQAIIDYMVRSGISGSRFVKKAFGNSGFVALNTNPDGSDNPEGRKYNRRVTFGIINPQTGVTIRQDSYTPEHLRQPGSMKYSIVLLNTTDNVASDYFAKLKIDEFHLIRSVKKDSLIIYLIGIFYNKNDASKYLIYAKDKGFKEAYIVTQYDINSLSMSLISPETDNSIITGSKIYTIQLSASKTRLDMKQFEMIKGIKEISSKDGFYRYVSGEYGSFEKAKEALRSIQESGFAKAFIRQINSADN